MGGLSVEGFAETPVAVVVVLGVEGGCGDCLTAYYFYYACEHVGLLVRGREDSDHRHESLSAQLEMIHGGIAAPPYHDMTGVTRPRSEEPSHVISPAQSQQVRCSAQYAGSVQCTVHSAQCMHNAHVHHAQQCTVRHRDRVHACMAGMVSGWWLVDIGCPTSRPCRCCTPRAPSFNRALACDKSCHVAALSSLYADPNRYCSLSIHRYQTSQSQFPVHWNNRRLLAAPGHLLPCSRALHVHHSTPYHTLCRSLCWPVQERAPRHQSCSPTTTAGPPIAGAGAGAGVGAGAVNKPTSSIYAISRQG